MLHTDGINLQLILNVPQLQTLLKLNYVFLGLCLNSFIAALFTVLILLLSDFYYGILIMSFVFVCFLFFSPEFLCEALNCLCI